jgi:hypothetical protein
MRAAATPSLLASVEHHFQEIFEHFIGHGAECFIDTLQPAGIQNPLSIYSVTRNFRATAVTAISVAGHVDDPSASWVMAGPLFPRRAGPLNPRSAWEFSPRLSTFQG